MSGAALLGASCQAATNAASSRAAPPGGVATRNGPAPAKGFGWEMRADRVAIFHEGARVADYVFSDQVTLRPHFQNVRAPTGVQVTRTHPPAAGDATDHATMHPGVWLAFGDINGEDFWRNKARIEHVRFTQAPELKGGALMFATENRFVARDGSEVGRLRSSIELRLSSANAFLLIWAAELGSDTRDLVFGDQEEMGLGVRLATPLSEKNGGLVATSEGVQGAKLAWGMTAAWAAYSRELDGQSRGIAIFPAATNPVPTWWHCRDYGVIVANGFGKRVLPAATEGKLIIKRGEKLSLRYGVLLFDTPAPVEIELGAAYRDFQRASATGP